MYLIGIYSLWANIPQRKKKNKKKGRINLGFIGMLVSLRNALTVRIGLDDYLIVFVVD